MSSRSESPMTPDTTATGENLSSLTPHPLILGCTACGMSVETHHRTRDGTHECPRCGHIVLSTEASL